MTKEQEKQIADWLEGDIYLRNGLSEGIISKDTDYDRMVESPDYVFQDQAYVPESPRDPYERSHTQETLDEITDCTTSIGGVDGKNFSRTGVWRRSCKIFYPMF